jgi:hypothetical protein
MRVTALLIVLALASLPAANVVCLAWCDAQPARAAGCHDQEGSSVLNAQDSCAVFVASPFLRQDVDPDIVLGLTLAHRLTAPNMATVGALVRGDWRFVGSPSRAPLVLRL